MEYLTNVISLIRHGESRKNIKLKHGGFGDSLTPKGRNQVIQNTLVFKGNTFTRPPIVYYYKGLTHIEETVSIFSTEIPCIINSSDKLKPISLGVLDDLSEIDATNSCPNDYARLQMWRNGLIDIKAVNITNGEDVIDFWNRGKAFADNNLYCDGTKMVIAERSYMILLLNILLGNDIKQDHGYKNFEIPTGGIITFVKKDDIYTINNEFSNFTLV